MVNSNINMVYVNLLLLEGVINVLYFLWGFKDEVNGIFLNFIFKILQFLLNFVMFEFNSGDIGVDKLKRKDLNNLFKLSKNVGEVLIWGVLINKK